MALTRVSGGILKQPIDVGIITATSLNASGIITAGTVQVGSATTIHTTGIDLGSGNVTSHNINSTGIITATSFVGPVTGNVTGNASGTAGGLTGSPSISVTNITASGNVSIGGTLTYEDVTNIDSVGVVTARTNIFLGDSLKHLGDTDTLISFPANDTITAHTNGSERLRITSDGSVGTGGLVASGGNLAVNSTIRSQNSSSNISYIGFTQYTGDTSVGSMFSYMGGDARNSGYLNFSTNDTERLRITSAGKIGIGTDSPSNFLHVKNYTSASNYITAENTTTGNAGVRLKNSQGDYAIFANAELIFYDLGNDEERLRITGDGPHLLLGGTSDVNEITESSSNTGMVIGSTSVGNGGIAIINSTTGTGRIYFGDATGSNAARNRGQINYYHNGDYMMFATAGSERLRITSAGVLQAAAGVNLQMASNGRIFVGNGGNATDPMFANVSDTNTGIAFPASDTMMFTTGGSENLSLHSSQSTLYGTSDGILNLDTTDARGSFIRYKQNGTTKGWAGCSEGLGTGGDQDDFGIRAVGEFRVRTGTANRIEISEEGQILLRPITGGFTTSGAAGTFPGAAVAIDCHGVGAGTGTNIPQYGLYVDASGSSNDATLMTGIFTISKQNTEGSAIGVHGLYERDWNSYSKKIGGLFQAPARATRYSTLSMNPGGGNFVNTTDTGHANKLATGGTRPDGAADGGATYGDATGLWGDVFRSDTDTSSEELRSVAIKATNRTTHALQKVGLVVGIVDGNDGTANRKRTNFVEYYANSSHQRYYAKNHRKEINQHYPIPTDSNAGNKQELLATHNAVYYYQNRPIYNTNSYYFFNTMGSSSARGGRLKVDITWSTGHASGSGEGSYSILYISKHSDSRVGVQRFTKFHQYYSGGSYYGWSSNPELLVYECTSTGSNAGIYLRVKGHMDKNSSTFDGYVVQSIKIEATESNYNFTTEPSFRFVGHSVPSDLGGQVSDSNPNT